MLIDRNGIRLLVQATCSPQHPLSLSLHSQAKIQYLFIILKGHTGCLYLLLLLLLQSGF